MRFTANRRSRRSLAVLAVVVSLTVMGVPGLPSAGALPTGPLFGNQILQWDEDGSGFKVFTEPSEPISIWLGRGVPDTDDGFFPATNVYVVAEGQATDINAMLVDVSNHAGDPGGIPNTVILASGGLFTDLTLGYTVPNGYLGNGVYGIVYDENQDGDFDAIDRFFYPAFEVHLAADVPHSDEAKAYAKEAAGLMAQAYGVGLRSSQDLLEAYGTLKEMYDFVKCAIPPNPTGFLACLTDYVAEKAREQALELIMLMLGIEDPKALALKSIQDSIWAYASLKADPPNPDYRNQVTLPPASDPQIAAATPSEAAEIELRQALSTETDLVTALVAALERFDGAQMQGDGEWALAHADTVMSLAAVLRTELPTSLAALSAFASAADDLPAGVDTIASWTGQAVERVRTAGFTDAETLTLMERGLDVEAITALRELIAVDPIGSFSQHALQDYMDSVAASYGELDAALGSLTTGFEAVRSELEAQPTVAGLWPVADAGGPYGAVARQPISLDGAASFDRDGELISWEWDLDRDGEFDDAAGATPTVEFDSSGQTLIGLRVTDDFGQAGFGYANVFVTDDNTPPSITNPAPAEPYFDVVAPATVGFSATFGDSDGDAVTGTWYLDYIQAGTGNSFSYAPSAADGFGPHFIRVVADDGIDQVAYEWVVTALAPDADGDEWRANVDCDDTDPALNPGAREVIGNGIDDDCDPSTADTGSPPKADFYARPQPAFAGDEIGFFDLSHDPNGPIAGWAWNFGDGTTFTEAEPTHVYSTFGDYTVRLEVTDPDGNTAAVEEAVTILAAPTSGALYGSLRLVDFVTDPVEGQPRTPYLDGSARTYGPDDIVMVAGLTPGIPTAQCELAAGGDPAYAGTGEDDPSTPPTATVYVIPDTGLPLEDGTTLPGSPVLVSAAVDGTFDQVPVATTQAGGLADGRYDLVLDHCNDGAYSAALDLVLGDGAGYAFSVRAAESTLPALQLGYMREYSLAAGLSLAGAGDGGFCAAFDAFAATVSPGDSPGFASQASRLSASCRALSPSWQELGGGAADPSYAALARLGPIAYDFAIDDDELVEATRRLANLFVEQVALVDALDVTVARFQGAFDADDYAAMLRQLDHMGDLVNLLVGGGGNVLRSYAALEALDAALDDEPWASRPEAGLLGSGISTARRGLAGLLEGLGPRFGVWRSCHVVGLDLMWPRGLQAWIIAYTTTDYGYLSSGIVSIPWILTGLGLWPLETHEPTAETTGPYLTPPGRDITFDASGSSDPDGDALSYAWDLDGDGAFDDGGTGTVTFSFPIPGTRLVGIEITDSEGHHDLHYTLLKVGDTAHQSMIVVRHAPRQLLRVDPDGTATLLADLRPLPGKPGDPIQSANPAAVVAEPDGSFYLLTTRGGLIQYDEQGAELRRLTKAAIEAMIGVPLIGLTDMVLDGSGSLIILADENLFDTSYHGPHVLLRLSADWSQADLLVRGLTETSEPSVAIAPDGRLVLGNLSSKLFGGTNVDGEGGIYTYDEESGVFDLILPGSTTQHAETGYSVTRLMMGGTFLVNDMQSGDSQFAGLQIDNRGGLIFSEGGGFFFRVPTPPSITEWTPPYNPSLTYRDVEAFLLFRSPNDDGTLAGLWDADIDAGGDYLFLAWDTTGTHNDMGVWRVTPYAELFKAGDLGSPTDFPGYGTASMPQAMEVIPDVREVTPADLWVRDSAASLRLEGPMVAQESCPGAATLSVTLNNTGTTATDAPVEVVFWDGDPLAGGTVIGAATVAGALAAGASAVASITWPDPAPGAHEIYASALGAATVGTAFSVCSRLVSADEEPLVLWPETAALPEGDTHEVRVLLRDPTGSPMVGVAVTFQVTGVHEMTVTTSSDSWGTARFSYTGSTPGIDEIAAFVGGAQSNPATVTWLLVNTAPEAVPQALTTNEDGPIMVTLGGSDPDGDRLSFAVVEPPQHGHLWGTPPELVYAPTSGFFGEDSFSFTAGDAYAASAPATVTIQILEVDYAPMPDAGGPYAVDEGGTVVLDATGSSDPDGDELTFAWDLDGDGEYDDAVGPEPTAGPFPDGPATHLAVVQVTDARGAAWTAVAEVEVANLPPAVGDVTLPESPVIAGHEATVGAAFADPAGSYDEPYSCTVDFGAGPSPGTVAGFECSASHSFATPGQYPITITITDKDGGFNTGQATIEVQEANQGPVADAGGPYAADEGGTVVLDATSSADPDGDELTFAWDLDGDGEYDDAVGSTPTAGPFPDGPATIAVALRATDPMGAAGTAQATIDVHNVAPTVTSPTLPEEPVRVDRSVIAEAAFSDPGGGHDAPYVCAVDFGDGVVAGVVSGSDCRAAHSYAAAGLYTVTITITDNDGGAGTAAASETVVVYDPNAGFVTGGGRIRSAAGSCPAAVGLAGDASFGFEVKYQKGSATPKGNIEFQFRAVPLNFHFDGFSWLVIAAGGPAIFEGTGTINGDRAPNGEPYRFMVWAGDGTPDTFRMRIWYGDPEETVVYDNGANQPLKSGSIVIHQRN